MGKGAVCQGTEYAGDVYRTGQHNEVPEPLSLKRNADLPLLRKNAPAQTGLQEENIMTKRRLRCIINKQKALTEGDDGMASSSILLYKIKFEQEYHIDEIINRIEIDDAELQGLNIAEQTVVEEVIRNTSKADFDCEIRNSTGSAEVEDGSVLQSVNRPRRTVIKL